jgi:hypothetical protein
MKKKPIGRKSRATVHLNVLRMSCECLYKGGKSYLGRSSSVCTVLNEFRHHTKLSP